MTANLWKKRIERLDKECEEVEVCARWHCDNIKNSSYQKIVSVKKESMFGDAILTVETEYSKGSDAFSEKGDRSRLIILSSAINKIFGKKCKK